MIGHAASAAFNPYCCTVQRNVCPAASASAAAFVASMAAEIAVIALTIPMIAKYAPNAAITP